MSHSRYINRSRYFDEMNSTARKYLVPWVENEVNLIGSRVLELGCGEAGNLLAFEAKEAEVVGLDSNLKRIEQGRRFINERFAESNIQLIAADAQDCNELGIGKFDLIILKDFIEHIDNDLLFPVLNKLLKDNGRIFIGYPPWLMPYGGHQQICKNRLGRLPWIHLLPERLFIGFLTLVGEDSERKEHLLEIYRLGLTIETLKARLTQAHFTVQKEDFFFIGPSYEARYRLTPKRVPTVLKKIPWFRNFYTTCYYGLISRSD